MKFLFKSGVNFPWEIFWHSTRSWLGIIRWSHYPLARILDSIYCEYRLLTVLTYKKDNVGRFIEWKSLYHWKFPKFFILNELIEDLKPDKQIKFSICRHQPFIKDSIEQQLLCFQLFFQTIPERSVYICFFFCYR